MSAGLPEAITGDDEIAVSWERDEDGTEVSIALAGATIFVKTDHESADVVQWLVAALPTVLSQAWDAIAAAEQPEEAP